MKLLRLAPADPREPASWTELLRVPDLSAGVYTLQVGAEDPQQPHSEDEIYYVVSGRGRFRCGGEDHELSAGVLLFVEAGAEHGFHSVSETLVLLVAFGPAEGSRAPR